MRKSLNFIKSTIVSVTATTLLLVLVSCNSSKKEKEATFDKVAAMQAIEKENKIFTDAFNKGDTINAVNGYAADAKFMPPNQKAASGRKDIQSTLAGFIKAGAGGLSIKPVEVWGDENMLTVEEEWSMTDKDGKEVDRGKALELWKMEDGKWKLFRDIFNSDLPCMAPPPSK
ncbi:MULTISPECIES: YybH family protein [Flavobacterium]|uniref:DUF4440 domain-containing protein n=1 Tax=Flavobacterium ranwuense TaxID=2541725 RepID=A0ABY2DP72_9FLAO|nr:MULTISPECIES: nuclear transport factor 2 family protein [Flavobacterium]TDE27993.1 DUF4440 domain-containing protein [Flavobacterium ranwuense]TDE53886.1 DUF4440 domain-containing protein [Flavobacterium sp. GT3P67]